MLIILIKSPQQKSNKYKYGCPKYSFLSYIAMTFVKISQFNMPTVEVLGEFFIFSDFFKNALFNYHTLKFHLTVCKDGSKNKKQCIIEI